MMLIFCVTEATETAAAYDKFSGNTTYISSTPLGKELNLRSAIKAKIADKQGEFNKNHKIQPFSLSLHARITHLLPRIIYFWHPL